jgi:hypothetical protein
VNHYGQELIIQLRQFLMSDQMSYTDIFPLSQRWPLNLSLTVHLFPTTIFWILQIKKKRIISFSKASSTATTLFFIGTARCTFEYYLSYQSLVSILYTMSISNIFNRFTGVIELRRPKVIKVFPVSTKSWQMKVICFFLHLYCYIINVQLFK